MAYTNENQQLMQKLSGEISKVIKGKGEAVQLILTALLAQGHVLIEDVPGVGKTTLAMALGKATGLSFRRAQFTPDVMASDITGFTMFNREENRFEYRSGLVMTNILLADEINRTSPKTQSALLEAMEEKRVTVDGVVHQLPEPFIVIATQNSQGYVGTFPLPEAQLDRFLMRISVGYPDRAAEMKMLEVMPQRQETQPVMPLEELMELRRQAAQVKVADNVKAYILSLVTATRFLQQVKLGASPRGSIAMFRAAQAMALMNGRDYATPDDVKAVAIPVLAHRIVLASGQTDYGAPQDIVAELLSNTHIPM